MKPLIKNETDYDARVVTGIVRYVFRHLDLDGKGVMVKVKNLKQRNKCYSGRFYPDPHETSRIYNKDGYSWNDVGPNVPKTVSRLIVCRIGSPDFYPRMNYVYKRKDSPGRWMLNDWREALVSVCAHEAMHLRQDRGKSSAPGKHNEVDTEWAAFRIHHDWVADQKQSPKVKTCSICNDPAVAEVRIVAANGEPSAADLCEAHALALKSTVHLHL